MPYKDRQKRLEYMRKWKMERDYDRKWFQEHKEHRKLYLREWRKKNPDKNNEYCRRWYEKNKDKRLAYFKEWREKHPNFSKEVRIAELKRRFKIIMAKGGKCELCGYDEFFTALQLHHLNPAEKEGKWIKESDLHKVMLLCANCHKALHSQKAEEFYSSLRKASIEP